MAIPTQWNVNWGSAGINMMYPNLPFYLAFASCTDTQKVTDSQLSKLSTWWGTCLLYCVLLQLCMQRQNIAYVSQESCPWWETYLDQWLPLTHLKILKDWNCTRTSSLGFLISIMATILVARFWKILKQFKRWRATLETAWTMKPLSSKLTQIDCMESIWRSCGQRPSPITLWRWSATILVKTLPSAIYLDKSSRPTAWWGYWTTTLSSLLCSSATRPAPLGCNATGSLTLLQLPWWTRASYRLTSQTQHHPVI